MIYKAKKSKLKDKRGRKLSITSPLIHPTKKPSQGWRVSFVLRGQKGEVKGATAGSAVNGWIKEAKIAGEPVNEVDAWLTANIQWMAQVPDKYHLVGFDQIEAITDEFEKKDLAPSNKTRDYVPSDFEGRGWHAMMYSLAQDRYDFDEFYSLCKNHVLRWLDSSSNPSIGCGDCFVAFSAKVHKLGLEKPNQDGARKWLWESHNEVRSRVDKEPIPLKDYYKDALWV